MTCGAETNQGKVSYIEEVTSGDIPTGNAQEIRFTGESMSVTKETTTSEEIRTDRQVSDLIMTKLEPAGDLNGEFSYGTYDDLLEGSLFNSWVNTNYASILVAVISGKFSFVDGGATLPASLIPGQYIRVSGFATGDNNGDFLITAIDTVLETIEVAETLVDEALGESVVFVSDVLSNGVEKHSYTIEKEFSDVVKFMDFTGMTINTFSMDFPAQDKISCVFNFLGQGTQVGDATPIVGTPIAPTTTDILNTGNNIGFIKEGGAAVGVIESASFEVSNNLRGLGAIGDIENICVASGRCNVTGNLSVYFEDFVKYQKFLDNTATSIIMELTDSNGQYYINLPKIKLTEANVNIDATDGDVMDEGGFQAMVDPVTLKTIIITKF